ncbi:hypothetical protein ABH15_08005 [Methanoculleus taiwanensis]|uniref:HTH tetR-type domain-containing protein n=1 Tax=Methanoculleus taiwanensis TaxID=1550565 RepID=A0A498H0E6_9EURY|nr:TetR/AcrR family transcriptional regulator [Methanoculleus taiwanensis]RXE56113.1 hypothetical protein ABH15_08005 [Methanoculleus taiwanensis]
MPKVIPEYKEDAKKKIIKAAIEVIAERGYAQATIHAIAQKLNVSKGAVYWYFPSREALLREVMATIQREMQKVTDESSRHATLEELYTELFSPIFEQFDLGDEERRALFYEMFALALRNSAVRGAAVDYIDALVSATESAIKREQKTGRIKARTDSRTLALIMVALYSGMLNYKMTSMGEEETRRIWREAMQLLILPQTNER